MYSHEMKGLLDTTTGTLSGFEPGSSLVQKSKRFILELLRCNLHAFQVIIFILIDAVFFENCDVVY